MITGFKNYISEVMQGKSGSFSSKRLVTMLCVLMLTIGFFVDLFSDYTITEYIFESISYIVIAGLGFTGAEAFAPTKVKEGSE